MKSLALVALALTLAAPVAHAQYYGHTGPQPFGGSGMQPYGGTLVPPTTYSPPVYQPAPVYRPQTCYSNRLGTAVYTSCY